MSEILRFWSFQDPAVQTAALAIALLGVMCGSLGCFLVLRKMSLLGDALGHAVLPGVCLGFVIAGSKQPRALFTGGLLAALVAAGIISFLQRRTRLKSDAVLGIVLSGGFALGTALLTRLQTTGTGSQSGLNQFLFGQASAILEEDVRLIAILTALVVLLIALFFKDWALLCFDQPFSEAIGRPVRSLSLALMLLMTVAIVAAIQAVGVVLVSAVLILPAATARLLTDRLLPMLGLAVAIGVAAGLLGLNASFLARSSPTGPFVVLALAAVFGSALLLAPRRGLVSEWLRRRGRALRVRDENLLKSIWQVTAGQPDALATAHAIAAHRSEHERSLTPGIASLVRQGLIQRSPHGFSLTAAGAARGAELVRNFRLWELFLTHEVNLPIDHTQRDAEDIEHVLDPELVRELESRFGDQLAIPPETPTR